MRLPTRRATPANPRITPEAKAEHALLQALSLHLGQHALAKHGYETEDIYPIPGVDATLRRVTNPPAGEADTVRLTVTVEVEVNLQTSAAIAVTPHA